MRPLVLPRLIVAKAVNIGVVGLACLDPRRDHQKGICQFNLQKDRVTEAS
jgi:hypothetical protein